MLGRRKFAAQNLDLAGHHGWKLLKGILALGELVLTSRELLIEGV